MTVFVAWFEVGEESGRRGGAYVTSEFDGKKEEGGPDTPSGREGWGPGPNPHTPLKQTFKILSNPGAHSGEANGGARDGRQWGCVGHTPKNSRNSSKGSKNWKPGAAAGSPWERSLVGGAGRRLEEGPIVGLGALLSCKRNRPKTVLNCGEFFV